MQSRPTWLVANWKMHGSTLRVQAFVYEVNAALASAPSALQCVFCPPSAYLAVAAQALPQNARLALGAQNCHAAKEGPHTGCVSAPMLADAGCRYVIIGHSECRAAGETDVQVQAKATAAMEAGLMPIICIGESLEAYTAKKTAQMLDAQLAPLAKLAVGHYLIAYEPIWAIGSGKTPTTAEITAAHVHIKSALGSETHVLYGGSVNAGNIGEILSLPEVSGALIGGASLEIETMRAMIAAAK
jgi:triosephosphate isomerase